MTDEVDFKKVMNSLENFDKCAECGSSDVECVSLSEFVPLCQLCCGAHKNIPGSQIRLLNAQLWTSCDVEKLKENYKSDHKKRLEEYLPIYYQTPSSISTNSLRNEFIKCKYINREFEHANATFLWDPIDISLPRVVNHHYGTLVNCQITASADSNVIFLNDQNGIQNNRKSYPFDGVRLSFANVNDREYLIISFDDKKVRHFFYFYGRSDSQYILLQSIRHLQYRKLEDLRKLSQQQQQQEKVKISLLLGSSDFLIGFLHKTGARLKEKWRQRWCVLIDNCLYYFTQELDYQSKGFLELFSSAGGSSMITNANAITSIDSQLPVNCRKTNAYPIVFKSKNRTYVFTAKSTSEQNRWLNALKSQMNNSIV